jgi:small-conductance mechanosensitive channel
MEAFQTILEWLKTAWSAQLFKMGQVEFTTSTIAFLLISFTLLFYITAKIKKILLNKIFPRYGMNPGMSSSIATIVRYILVTIGVILIFQSTGINLSSLGILFGALGVGIGFGLQNITNNLISGIIILFERPVKVGDRIEVGNVVGNISSISARATTVISNDNIAIIVPNSEFISSTVINWSHNDRNVRFNFPVGVSYNEDPAKIKKLLLEVAKANPGVLQTPPPDVLFKAFGESSLDFILRVWTTQYSDTPFVLKSQLYYSIFEKFKQHGVEIPFPQRDLHLKSGFEKPIKEAFN